MKCFACETEPAEKTGTCECGGTRLPSVRSDSLLAEALTAIRALVQELSGYTSVHGADEDDDQALALGREVLSKANKEIGTNATNQG